MNPVLREKAGVSRPCFVVRTSGTGHIQELFTYGIRTTYATGGPGSRFMG